MSSAELSKEEVCRRGEDIYRRSIRSALSEADRGKLVVIDVKSGDYEIDSDDLAASDRLRTRHPDALAYALRAGYTAAVYIGARPQEVPIGQEVGEVDAPRPAYPDLRGKVAILTGAAGNLGRAVARRLHAEGMRLALVDLREDALQQMIQAEGMPVDTVRGALDLAQSGEAEQFLERVWQQYGSIDALANIAGGFTFSGPVHQMDPTDLDAMLAVNVKTAFTLSAAVARKMADAGATGAIVNVSARAALSGPAGMAAYSASKAAVLRLTESMAAELLNQGIRVNAVLPSTLDTPQNRAAMPNVDPTAWVAPDSLAGVIAFLLSDAARDISGAGIPVYGRA